VLRSRKGTRVALAGLRLAAVVLALLCVLVLAGAGTAGAKEARLETPSLGSFTEARGLAVDQGSGDIYALDGRVEEQRITVSASAGNFKLQFGGGEAELKFNASAGEAEAALQGLACGGGPCVIVNGGPGGSNPYEVHFGGVLATTEVEQIGCVDGSPPLSGGSGCSVQTTIDGVNGTIARYQDDGSPSDFSALGSNLIDGRGGADKVQPPPEGLHFSIARLVQVAVDESGGATDGEIYVTQSGDHRVDVFAPSGEFKGQLTEYKEGLEFKPLKNVCGVAVDAAGDVYVADFATGIHKYDPSGDPVTSADSVANFTTVSFPCALAAGAGPTAGSLFAVGFFGELFKLSATSGVVDYEISAGNTTVTVDPTSGHVLAAAGGEAKVWDAAGASPALLESIAAGSEVRGVAVDGTTGKGGTVYLSRAGVGHLDVYGPVVEVPEVFTKEASEVAGTTATLNGTIDADGGPAASCHFEYVTEEQFKESKFATATSVPCEPPGPFSGSTVNPVHADVEGLSVETAYEFRLVGENSNGQIPAAPLELETQGKPLIAGGTASQITATTALISGAVNARGSETEAAVEYLTEEQFEAAGFTGAALAPAPNLPGFVTGSGDLSAATGSGDTFDTAGTGNLSAGSNAVTGLSTSSGAFKVGQGISGAGIPAGTEITAVGAGGPGTLSLSANASAGGAAVALKAGTNLLTNVITATGAFAPGQSISGTGIPPGTRILAVGEGSLELSADFSANEAAVALSAGSEKVTNLTTAKGSFGPGQRISGPGIADGTTILVAQAGQLTLSKAATQQVTGAALQASGPQPLAVELSGLSPETPYVFRLVAESSAGVADPGKAGAFATFPPLGPPLPDERAYELLTPAQKIGEPYVPEPDQRGGLGGSCFHCTPGWDKQRMPMQSSPEGDALAYEGNPFEAGLASGANEYRARRGAGGWATSGLSTPKFRDELGAGIGSGQGFKAFSADLTKAIVLQAEPSLTSEAPSDFANLYLQEEGKEDLTTLITTQPPNRAPGISDLNAFRLNYAGANAGSESAAPFTHVIFQANDALTGEVPGIAPEAPPVGAEETDLYEWSGGELHLVNVLPGNGEAAANAVFGSARLLALGGGENFDFDQAISEDGQRIFWSTKPGGQVYVREGGTTTMEIPDPGRFITATPDGSKVLLDDGVLYDLESATPTDLTGGEGGFLGIAGKSEDLARIYFLDAKALTPPSEENENEEAALEGEPNLYLWEEGAVSFIARLLASDNETGNGTLGTWHAAPGNRPAQASADGRFLAFESRAPLTGYDSTRAGGGGCVGTSEQGNPQCFEVFEYDTQEGSLTCPSCNPSGQAPLGASNLALIRGIAESFPQPQSLPPKGEGRLFFESQDALLPADANGHIQDVYEWEPNGVGDCARPRGCLALISAGSSPKDSHLIDASATGNDVFFDTRSQLVPADKDDFLDIYDARVGGGFEEPGSAPCAGEACAGPIPPSPPFPSPSSSLPREAEAKPRPHCRRGYVRRHGKCVRKHRKHRHHRAAKQRGGRGR
jgi:hypothetical protein